MSRRNIKIVAGETFACRIRLNVPPGFTFEEGSRTVFVIRDKNNDKAICHEILSLEEDGRGYYVDVKLHHSQTEKLVDKVYRYGVVVLHPVQEWGEHCPIEAGVIKYPIIEAKITVLQPVARREGLDA